MSRCRHRSEIRRAVEGALDTLALVTTRLQQHRSQQEHELGQEPEAPRPSSPAEEPGLLAELSRVRAQGTRRAAEAAAELAQVQSTLEYLLGAVHEQAETERRVAAHAALLMAQRQRQEFEVRLQQAQIPALLQLEDMQGRVGALAFIIGSKDQEIQALRQDVENMRAVQRTILTQLGLNLPTVVPVGTAVATKQLGDMQ